jgi:CRISPR-associated protein Cas1
VRLWSDLNGGRISVARAMYAIRFHESLPQDDINTLRGMEGVRVKDAYRELAVEWGIPWRGRHYDRQNPQGCDMANQAINHAATAVEGAAMIAVASTGTVPGLGFVHEDPGISWVLDVADLVRTTVTIPIAFQAARDVQQGSKHPIERQVRYVASRIFRDQELIAVLIDHIKSVLSCGIQS